MYQLSKRSTRHLNGVNPLLIDVVKLALTLTKVDFGIPSSGGFRTVDEQNALFRTGNSQLDGLVKISNHQTGNAFDVFAYVDGKGSWDFDDLAEVATAILAAASKLKVPLTWGGHWVNFVDAPHFEIDGDRL
jgi:peptidoglycan L-alanyl-D-glutamate endopeptidase CwlK